MILNWIQARKAFLLKAVMAVAEASAAQEEEVASANNKQKQQEICADLKAKVGSVINLAQAHLFCTAKLKMNAGKNLKF